MANRLGEEPDMSETKNPYYIRVELAEHLPLVKNFLRA